MLREDTAGNWQFINVNNELSFAKIAKESSSSIIGIFKLWNDDRFLQFHIRPDHISQKSASSKTADAVHQVYIALTVGLENTLIVVMEEKLVISIQRKKSETMDVETNVTKVSGESLTSLLFECNSFLIKNVVVFGHLRNFTSHLAAEKDRAIEFLGNTAKDYGANNTILRWAPENSPNYRAMMKYNPESVLEDGAPDKLINSDLININELNDTIQNNATVMIRSFDKKEKSTHENKSSHNDWESDFGDGEVGDDSLLDRFGLDENLKLSSDQVTESQDDIGSETEPKSDSETDVEYESPKKRTRHGG
ncbi:unnamed protein product [Kluyveromyces dobzhanskii CBS 2104]|uniref:WGS project CCBQ000000000 data, contig 00058 n=1 Tax=Kluyveromyces dobzhanskii CBS 2104 TaxID=1427455 RepID=A0A0A8LDI6_9SACH|nr:unnamed protein product [Kluyveromyces dobzhanskii CBS 2104]